MRSLLPPHIAWPGLVVLILSIGISAVGYTIYHSQKDGGVAMIDDYSVHAADWEELSAARGASNGWTGTLTFSDEEPPRLHLELFDAEGNPVSVNESTIALRQPHHESPFFETDLNEEAPGEYSSLVPLLNTGLWDAIVRGTVNAEPVEHTLRFEHDQ